MINKLLHALANRSGPFQDPAFVGACNFVPAVLNEQEKKLRALMLLDVTSTDYYLRAYFSVLEAFPDIKALAEDTVTSYSVLDMPPRGLEIDGAQFLSKMSARGYYLDSAPESLPVPLNYQLTYTDGQNLKLAGVENGLVRVVNYQKSGTDPEATLRIEWPAEFPFSGPLTLSQAWAEGSMVQIQVTPSAFPYRLVAERITGHPWLVQLLVRNKFVDEYTAVPDPQRKVALALIVLALSNPSVYPV